ncbi:Erp family outer-surface lipoprotein [Borreliella valaisiana]|uniref:Outer surface protein E n=2 Tax=Borreliella valaisiana TaxID=62088 RepID=C0R9F9_BORVA|nr:Erp family outer-surface lipoprotein [Borreliella valaisiana]ACN53073.1 outer surface protein E [Borreliella valaisiana VS116]
MNKKMFIICSVFSLIISCENFTSRLSEQGRLSEQDISLRGQVSSDTIKFSEFTVKIKNKDTNSSWIDLGVLVIRKEIDGIETGLNAKGHSATFFSLEELEVNNFVKAMTEGGSFKTNLYYGYKDEQSITNGIKDKNIITKIENINGSEHITFLGDKTAEYAIPLEELKKNLK